MQPVSRNVYSQSVGPSIRRARPTAPMTFLNHRRGRGDDLCMYELTGSSGGDHNPDARSMYSYCSPSMDSDGTSHEYVRCLNKHLLQGMDACGFSYSMPSNSACRSSSQHDSTDPMSATFPSEQSKRAAATFWKHQSEQSACLRPPQMFSGTHTPSL